MNKTKNNFINPLLMGVGVWYFLLRKPKKTAVISTPGYEPIGLDYQPQFFKDSEYFGNNSIPYDYYKNWLEIAKDLDKIRVAFANPILIKKGFNIREPKFVTCEAVEIYPQNNNIQRLTEVIEFMKPELKFKIIEKKDNKNIYLEL